MNRPTFPEGAAVAFLASIGGGVLISFAATLLPGAGVQRLIIAALGLGYILYLQGRSPVHAGRLVVFVSWTITAGAIALVDVSPVLYVMLHVGLIWLIRSLYFYVGIVPALMDLALSGLSLVTAFWAYTHTHSPALGIWCFFLTQALFVAIPHRLTPKPGHKASSTEHENDFERAHRAAQDALRKLLSNNA